VQLVTHVENNNLAKVWDLSPSYATGLEYSIKGNALWAKLTGVATTITAGNKLTNSPTALFGDNSPLSPYPAMSSLNSVTWNSITTLAAWFKGFSFKSECRLDMSEYLHTTTLGLHNARERNVSEIAVQLLVDDEADLRSVFDAVGTSSNLVCKFARTATDYHQITFHNTALKSFHCQPYPWKVDEETGVAQLADLVFTPPTLGAGTTTITVLERQATIITAACYEL
jgi:hypothetical protein